MSLLVQDVELLNRIERGNTMPKYVGRVEKDFWGDYRVVARQEASVEDYIGTGVDVAFNVFRSLNELGEYNKAKAVSRRYDIAVSAFNDGCFQAALDIVNPMIKKMPREDALYWLRAQIYLGAARKWEDKDNARAARDCFMSAITDLNTAVVIDNNDVDFYYLRGMIQANLGLLTNAASDAATCIRMKPNDAEFRLFQSAIFAKIKDYKQALTSVNEAILLAPNAEAYGTRGWIYLMMSDYPNAIEDLNRAITLESIDPDDYENRAKAYQAVGYSISAEAPPQPPVYQKAIPDDVSKRYTKWNVNFAVGETTPLILVASLTCLIPILGTIIAVVTIIQVINMRATGWYRPRLIMPILIFLMSIPLTVLTIPVLAEKFR